MRDADSFATNSSRCELHEQITEHESNAYDKPLLKAAIVAMRN
jgi:hypothetical protein